MRVVEEGSGQPAVLLVHGWAADAADWAGQLPGLAERHRVLAPDLPGFGRSSRTGSGLSPRGFARDLAGLLEDRGVSGAVVVGHSMGAVVASVLAVERPDLVSAVVVLDPSYGVPPEGWPERRDLVRAVRERGSAAAAEAVGSWGSEATPPGLLDPLVRRALATDPGVLLASLEALFEAEDELCSRAAAERYLAGRTQPVLAVHADPAGAAWEAGLLADPRGRAIAWEGAGHWLQLERPEELTRLLLDWIGEASAERSGVAL